MGQSRGNQKSSGGTAGGTIGPTATALEGVAAAAAAAAVGVRAVGVRPPCIPVVSEGMPTWDTVERLLGIPLPVLNGAKTGALPATENIGTLRIAEAGSIPPCSPRTTPPAISMLLFDVPGAVAAAGVTVAGVGPVLPDAVCNGRSAVWID